MAHFQQLRFVQTVAQHLAPNWNGLSVIEIGSHDVNGSVRPFFAGSRYVGVDLSPGDDVDLVASGHEVSLPDGSFDLAVSSECFEHNPQWLETFRNMHRMTKAGGIVLITCASRGRLEHGTSRTTPAQSPGTASIGWDYYFNLNRSDFEAQLDLNAMFEHHAFLRNDVSQDLYFVGKKAGHESALRLDIPSLTDVASATNSLVVADRPFHLNRWLGTVWEWPLGWAERLPDPQYQNFVRFWTGTEKTIRRLLGR